MDNQTLDRLKNGDFRRHVIKAALLLKGSGQRRLFLLARGKRSGSFPGETVEVRSVIELSNICRQKCNFCNIHNYAKHKKYLIDPSRFISIVEHIYKKGRRILLLQSGENPSANYIDLTAGYIRRIKRKYPGLKIILCLGSLKRRQYEKLRSAGADRYILKFETSNAKLYSKVKPGDSLLRRAACMRYIEKSGFALGTGNIVGLPGQSLNDLAEDLLFLGRFKLTMASASVFIPGEDSVYRDEPAGDIDITLNYISLMRIMYPRLIIPSTSSMEKFRKNGQYFGLMAGANSVTIHDGTPAELKNDFPIYSVNRTAPDEPHIRKTVKKAGLTLSKSELRHA